MNPIRGTCEGTWGADETRTRVHPFQTVLLTYAWAIGLLTVVLLGVMTAQQLAERRRRRRTSRRR